MRGCGTDSIHTATGAADIGAVRNFASAKSSDHNHRDETLRTPPVVNNTPPEQATEPIETAERVNPHADDIKRIESDAGVFLSRVAKLILHDEGTAESSVLWIQAGR